MPDVDSYALLQFSYTYIEVRNAFYNVIVTCAASFPTPRSPEFVEIYPRFCEPINF